MKNFHPLIAMPMVNEARVLPATHDLAPGCIALVNDSRLVGANYNESLTQFTVGYRDPENLISVVDYVAPPVPVGRRFDWKKSDNVKDFLTETDDERAIGAGFKRVEYSGSEQTSKTRNRGLMYILDRDEDGGATTEEQIVAMLQQRIIRNKYRRAITALSAITAGNAAVFSGATQPDEILKASLAAAQLETGVYPNRGLIGLAAWNLRSAAYAGNDKAGAFSGLVKKPADVAGDLFLDDLRVDKAVYQSGAAAKSRIVPQSFFGFHGRDGLMKDDPSTLKQFYTPIEGKRWRVFRKLTGPGDKFIEIIVEHYEIIVATSPIGVARENIANA